MVKASQGTRALTLETLKKNLQTACSEPEDSENPSKRWWRLLAIAKSTVSLLGTGTPEAQIIADALHKAANEFDYHDLVKRFNELGLEPTG